MTNNPESNENQSKMYALFYSFFLIPFMLAIFGALFFFMFQFLTYEKNTPIDLLNNIQSGSATKRWQSAFELSNMLTPDKINDKSLFENKLKDLFEKSKYDDSKVRTYLALAMGKTKNESFGNVLLDALNDEDKFVRLAGIKSLGLEDKISQTFSISEIIPSAGQAVVALQCKKNNDIITKLLQRVNHQSTHNCMAAERNVLKVLEGDCETAVGAISNINNNQIILEAELFSLDGKQRFYHKASKEIKYATLLGLEVGEILKKESKNSYKR